MSVKVTAHMVCLMLNKRIDDLETKIEGMQSEIVSVREEIDDLEAVITNLENIPPDTVLDELQADTPKPKAAAKKKAVKNPIPKTKKFKTVNW